MPVPTQDQLQSLILAEVGAVVGIDGTAVTPGAPVAAETPELAAAFASVATLLPMIFALFPLQAMAGTEGARLQYLYAKKQALDILCGGTWQDVDFSEAGVEEKLSQAFKNLCEMRDSTVADLKLLNSQIQASGGAMVAQQSTAQPLAPCSNWQPDPNNPRYKGNPLLPNSPSAQAPYWGPFGDFGPAWPDGSTS